MITASAEVIST